MNKNIQEVKAEVDTCDSFLFVAVNNNEIHLIYDSMTLTTLMRISFILQKEITERMSSI